MEPMAEQRARLAAVDDELARLQARYELTMSAVKFDEASALQRRIAALEAERRILAQSFPPTAAPEPPTGIVPMLGKPRRRRPRRTR